MRGRRYQALIVAILLITLAPYTPLMNIQSSQHANPATQGRDPSFPEMDSDGDGLNDSYELELGFDRGAIAPPHRPRRLLLRSPCPQSS